MSYETFKERVNALVKKAGGGINVSFRNDTELGKFYANCSDGTTIIGNSTNIKVTVRFGAHNALATI